MLLFLCFLRLFAHTCSTCSLAPAVGRVIYDNLNNIIKRSKVSQPRKRTESSKSSFTPLPLKVSLQLAANYLKDADFNSIFGT